MRYPHEKKEDVAARMLILEAMEIALRTGHTEEAKELGVSSKKLSDKIATYEYPETELEKAAKRIRDAGFTPHYFKP